MEQETELRQELFEQLFSALKAENPALDDERIRADFAPLLNGEMDYATHRQWLEARYGN